MGIFDIEQNNFLVFERGPSENLTLQWGTYRDASDQTSLSRIWGGIHPPADDIPGRIMGDEIGRESFALAKAYFEGRTQLRFDNFLIEISSESCTGANDGQILVEATDYYDYLATMDNRDYEFNNQLIINDLGPGTYQLCLNIKGQQEPGQCYDIIVPELEPFQVNAQLNETGKNAIVSVEVKEGTAPYFVEINNELRASFQQTSFDVQVKDGDKIKIFSSRLCEGSFEEIIDILPAIILHPNPAASHALIDLKVNPRQVKAGIYSLSGQLLIEREFKSGGRNISLPLDGLSNGVYLLRIKYDGEEKLMKLLKN